MLFAGIDAGSRSIKIAIYDAERKRAVAQATADQGVAQDALVRDLYETLLARENLSASRITGVVATGYGRNVITFADTTITEITCHAHGVRHLAPDARTIIEIGGQDSKLIRLGADGHVRDFSMNDRCAAGTGRFLEMVASRLELSLVALGPLAAAATCPASISSMCVVFAETEIVGLLASGASSQDIIAGVQAAVAKRIAAMAGRNVEGPIAFTGGVAMISGMAAALETALGQPITVVPTPQMTGALGAAILASRD